MATRCVGAVGQWDHKAGWTANIPIQIDVLGRQPAPRPPTVRGATCPSRQAEPTRVRPRNQVQMTVRSDPRSRRATREGRSLPNLLVYSPASHKPIASPGVNFKADKVACCLSCKRLDMVPQSALAAWNRPGVVDDGIAMHETRDEPFVSRGSCFWAGS